MSEGEDGAFKAVELAEQSAESSDPEPQSAAQLPLTQEEPVGEPSKPAEKVPPPSAPGPEAGGSRWKTTLDQFKLRRYFVLRPGTLDHAIEDLKRLSDQEENGNVLSVWLLAELDHWNNERERVVLITENTLLICKYDFMMLQCEQIQKIPLNYVDRIVHGVFSFPPRSLLSRQGEGLRVHWDRQREPAFSSRWNPFSVDYPYFTFTYHPVRAIDDKFAELCELKNFQEQLFEAARAAHERKPVPGKANGVVVLNQPILIEAYVGLMAFIGNQNRLGYCLARGNIGF
ncbi:tumor protein p63-regulated gene 1 protein [Anguilla anguilla]|uniref:tumor protein p63-regulated gene 1 protein n=1 Tax=Anguilla anguilla TaxID=7936 RepID=UPI0015A94DCA|nr:tumor protein p63-regulated gene 1 protein [Anguilla anguilla]